MKTAHGLIIGKFYPPHAGHHLLVRTAAAQCERVTVIVMAASHETIPRADRVAWLREEHRSETNVLVTDIADDVPIDYDDPLIWDQHVALMQSALAQVQAPPVTAVFTAETYGRELARRFQAKPVTLDVDRSLLRASSTEVRSDVPGSWDLLSAPVKAGLALQVVVLGAESTGTTTLSRQLAQRLRERGGAYGATRWVAEYGRAYSVAKWAAAVTEAQLRDAPSPSFEQLLWRSDEFVHIASTQQEHQQAEARLGGPVLVCDTDAFATAIWHERYLGTRNAQVEAIARRDRPALVLVTHHEGVPFEQDGLRDGESIRAWMTQRFMAALQAEGRPHVVLRGSAEERLQRALAELDALMARSWRYAPPLG